MKPSGPAFEFVGLDLVRRADGVSATRVPSGASWRIDGGADAEPALTGADYGEGMGGYDMEIPLEGTALRSPSTGILRAVTLFQLDTQWFAALPRNPSENILCRPACRGQGSR